MAKRTLLGFFLICCSILLPAQVKWTSFDELPELYKKEQRPVLLFFHTDWCKICKMQEATVFSDSSIQKMLDSNFYALRLNAEDKNAVSFFGRKYKGASSNRFHSLAEYFGQVQSQLNFPSMIILNDHLQLVYKKGGFVPKEEMKQILEISRSRTEN